jgi:capsular polysaccharide transport system ATP-binding protein
MSVRLEKLTKTVLVDGKPRVLFDGLDLEIGGSDRVGILGLPKSGKTTLLRLICGTERPDSGRIHRDGKISWLIPSSDFLVTNSSVAWNIRSIGRLYGVNDPEFTRRVAELGGLVEYLNVPLSKCPPFVKQQLGFAAGIGMDFDLYLFDNRMVPSRKEFKDAAVVHLTERTEGKAVLVATGAAPTVAESCDTAYVLEYGRVTHFADVKEGADYFKDLLKAEADRNKMAGGLQKSDEEEVVDMTAEEGERSVELVQAAVADIF